MAAPELKIKNRTAYFRKAISRPQFDSESVLTRDAFEFVELWLTRNCIAALPYWRQAGAYFEASRNLPVVSAPLTTYYCFLNATKALLLVKGIAFTDNHGVTGRRAAGARRVIANEEIEIKGGGVLAALSSYLGEAHLTKEFTVADALGNLPFIHRAYRHTFRSKPDIFIPLRNPLYRKHPTDPYVWFSAEIKEPSLIQECCARCRPSSKSMGDFRHVSFAQGSGRNGSVAVHRQTRRLRPCRGCGRYIGGCVGKSRLYLHPSTSGT